MYLCKTTPYSSSSTLPTFIQKNCNLFQTLERGFNVTTDGWVLGLHLVLLALIPTSLCNSSPGEANPIVGAIN